MNPKVTELCGNPLFQLNLSIWMAQPKPENSPLRPIFYESGFGIYSIGLLLALPPDIKLIAEGSVPNHQSGAKPELVLVTTNRKKLCLLECKKSSFGVESTTAHQARTLMMLSGPIVAEVTAIAARGSVIGILAYLTRWDQVVGLYSTLASLKKELDNAKIDCGKFGCLGLISGEHAISVEYSDAFREQMGFKDKSPVKVIAIDDDTDPRPLYFIPYDPSVFNDQSAEEQKLCRRILFERFLSHVLSVIGSAPVPSEIVFTKEALLEAATLGIFRVWDDSEAKKCMRGLLRDFMSSLINSLSQDLKKFFEHDTKRGWVVRLDDNKNKEEILKQVSKFKPKEMDLGSEIQYELGL